MTNLTDETGLPDRRKIMGTIHPWWYGSKKRPPKRPTDETVEQYRGALLRIASGDAGDWKCNCPAHEIAQAALDEAP